ncbi:MAG: DNA adenine methylase, partial [Candidatus Scalindua sp.]|nr:DNA adenine methylase [Candidatus Scalindua sp.]
MVRPGNVKQLFAYFGGKQAVASRLVPMIPEHELFVELFAGGLA